MKKVNELEPEVKVGSLNIYVETGGHSISDRKEEGVSHYVSIENPLGDNFERNKDNWYKLIRKVREELPKQGFRVRDSFHHDYMTEEYVFPVEEKMQGGETFTRDALASGLNVIADSFAKEHYPHSTTVQGSKGQAQARA